ncbi:MAG: prolyl oligopeptidase family serine peptidase [Pseudomonadota bacterium]
MKYFILCFAIVLHFVSSAVAENTHPIPPLKAYGALPEISSAEISPDGTKVATIVHFDDRSMMLVISLVGDPPIPIGISNMKPRAVSFYDNDYVILRLSDTTSTIGFRAEYEFDTAVAINLKSNEFEQLLLGTRGLYPAQSGLGRIVGRAAEPGTVYMPAFVGPATREPSLDLFKVNLNSPRGRTFKRGTRDTIDWFIGNDGRVLARERFNNQSNKYRLEAYKNKKWENILQRTYELGPVRMLGVMPDESGLIFVETQADGFDALMKIGFDGAFEGPIIESRDREIEAYLIDSNRKFAGVRYSGVDPEYQFLDPALQESYDYVSQALPNATIYLDSWSDQRDTVLYQVFEPSIGDVWLTHKVSTGALQNIANRRPDIPGNAIGGMFEVFYDARDGLSIQAIVTGPPGWVPGEGPPLPAIVMPHGGPAAYDRFGFDWMAQFFANRGYLILQPNFRGSTGFGRAFQDAGRGEWGGKMQDDITDGVHAMVNSSYIDPNRVCIAGASYGGYAALAGAAFTPELYKCVIAIAPVSDLNRMLASEKRQSGSDHWVVSYWEDIMAEGDARRKKLRNISPVNYAENVQAPVLLLHGDDDTVVPFAQSKAMERALKRADKSVELVRLKGEDHWLSVADTRLQTLREMDRFISEHLPVEN